jgi:ABC-type enterochelin transport system permease subunit
MELIEMIAWIVLSFIALLGGLVLVSWKFRHTGKIVLRTEMRGGEYLIGL